MTRSNFDNMWVDAELIGIYEHLHSNPELSMAEHHTSQYLRTAMVDLGLEVVAIGSTGFVAIVRNGEGPVVAFRADMDGLPIKEETGLAFASKIQVKGPDGSSIPVMHACGHDIHMTVAVGLARHLLGDRNGWSGTVLLIFQPGEESAEGAKEMVEAGLWERIPLPECIFGLHVWPLPPGMVELTSGDTMAMGDSFEVTISGVGGHASQPQNTVDPIVIAALSIVALQSIVSRRINPLTPGVVTVGSIHGGSKENIIPAEVTFTLNVRSTEPSQRNVMLSAIDQVLTGIASTHGAPRPVIRRINSFPRLYSNPSLVSRLRRTFAATLGDGSVLLGHTKMASEDFGFLAQALDVPCAYWFIGGIDPKMHVDGPVPQNHSGYFAPAPVATLDIGIKTAVLACYLVVGAESRLEHLEVPDCTYRQ